MRKNTRYLQIAAYVLLAVIFIFLIGITRDCGRIQYSALEGRSGGDTIDIALIYGPGAYYIYDDSLAGINHEIAEIFSQEDSVPMKFWPVSGPAEGMEKLEAGIFDILASLPLDNYIKNRFPVSESIFLDRLVLVQLSDSSGNKAVESSLQLNGKEVHVAAGSAAIGRLQNLSEEIGGSITIVEHPEMSDELICLQVAASNLPLAVVNERVAKKIAETYPNLSYDSSVSFTQFQVWVFNPKDSLVAKKFNIWFDEFRLSDQYRTIITTF